MSIINAAALPLRVLPDEEVVFATRASVYDMRYGDDGEAFWHKRGSGKLQVLQNCTTRLVRVFAMDRKSREPIANFALMPQLALVPCAQAESARAADNAWVVKVEDLSTGTPTTAHVAMRVKSIALVGEFLAAVKEGCAENARHPSALDSLYRESPATGASAAAVPSSERGVGQDDSPAAAEPPVLQVSPRLSPRGPGDEDPAPTVLSSAPPQQLAAGVSELVRPEPAARPSGVSFGESPSRRHKMASPAATRSSPEPVNAAGNAQAADSPAEPPFGEAQVAALQTAYGLGRIAPGGEAMSRRCAAALGVSAGDTVLDAGAGAGGPSADLARLTGARITAADESSACVAAARAVLSSDSAADVRQLVDVVESSVSAGVEGALDGRTFDAAVLRCVLSHAADPHAVLRRAVSLVRPGGRVVVADRAWGPQAGESPGAIAAYKSRGVTLRASRDVQAAMRSAGLVVESTSEDAPTSETVISLRSCNRLLHGRIKACQAAGDHAGAMPSLRAGLAAEIGRVEAGIVRFVVIVGRRPEPPSAAVKAAPPSRAEEPSAAVATPVAWNAADVEKPAAATDGDGTVLKTIGAAAVVGAALLGGWMLWTGTPPSEVGAALRRAGRAVVEGVTGSASE